MRTTFRARRQYRPRVQPTRGLLHDVNAADRHGRCSTFSDFDIVPKVLTITTVRPEGATTIFDTRRRGPSQGSLLGCYHGLPHCLPGASTRDRRISEHKLKKNRIPHTKASRVARPSTWHILPDCRTYDHVVRGAPCRAFHNRILPVISRTHRRSHVCSPLPTLPIFDYNEFCRQSLAHHENSLTTGAMERGDRQGRLKELAGLILRSGASWGM